MVNLFSLSLSPFEAWEKNIPFSFSSRKLRIFFQISLSLLKTGERIFRFLLLLLKLEKIVSNFSFSSRLNFLASRHTLPDSRIFDKSINNNVKMIADQFRHYNVFRFWVWVTNVWKYPKRTTFWIYFPKRLIPKHE